MIDSYKNRNKCNFTPDLVANELPFILVKLFNYSNFKHNNYNNIRLKCFNIYRWKVFASSCIRRKVCVSSQQKG